MIVHGYSTSFLLTARTLLLNCGAAPTVVLNFLAGATVLRIVREIGSDKNEN